MLLFLLELKALSIVVIEYISEILDNIMKNTIRNTLLITTAITALAGVGFASAQSGGDRREAPAAAAHDQKAPEGKTEGTAGREPGSVPPKPAAQVPEKGKSAPTAQVPEKDKPASTAQVPEKPQTTGQGSPPSQKPGMAPAPVALSAEQHVKIRETLRGEKVEHLNNVPFSITVGEAIPRTVHLYRFPVSVMTYAPQYRDYEYFMVGDEILVVDPGTLRIVAVIPA